MNPILLMQCFLQLGCMFKCFLCNCAIKITLKFRLQFICPLFDLQLDSLFILSDVLLVFRLQLLRESLLNLTSETLFDDFREGLIEFGFDLLSQLLL